MRLTPPAVLATERREGSAAELHLQRSNKQSTENKDDATVVPEWTCEQKNFGSGSQFTLFRGEPR